MSEFDLEARLAAIEGELRHLRDLEEIRMLRYRYHELNNEHLSPQIVDLFAPGGAIDFGYMGRGSLKHFRGSVKRTAFIIQFIHNHIVEISGDTASGSSYQEGKAVFHGRAFIIAGRYDDEYVRLPEGWRFKTMRFEPRIMLPSDSSWADPETRRVDPHAGFIERDAEGNTIMTGLLDDDPDDLAPEERH